VPSTPKITSRPKPMAGLPLHDGSGSGGCDSGELSDWGISCRPRLSMGSIRRSRLWLGVDRWCSDRSGRIVRALAVAKMKAGAMGDVLFTFDVNATPDAVRRALTTTEGIASFWTDKADVPAEVGETPKLGFPEAPLPFDLLLAQTTK
jgi:hypothetical protein